MAPRRPSQSEIAATKKAARQEEMERDIANGRLVVRQMTPEEREQAEARRAAARRATRHARRSPAVADPRHDARFAEHRGARGGGALRPRALRALPGQDVRAATHEHEPPA